MSTANIILNDWYVARTQPQREEVAKINLERQGIEAFLPRFWKTYRRATKFEDRLRPVFPGYIFFQSGIDPARWRNVGGTLGVSHVLLGSARKPAAVPSPFMTALSGSCVDGILRVDEAALKIGSQVQISGGPFTGMLAKVCTLDDRGRVSLFLDFMGGIITRMCAHEVECVA